VEFRLATHTETGRLMVEVWKDGNFVAGIYKHDDGVKIVSKYLDGVEQEPGYPPAIVVHLSKVEGSEAPPELAEVGEGLAIDLTRLKENLKYINWTEDTAKTWLTSQFQIDPRGSFTEVLQRLTREQAEEFVKEIQDRVAKRQPELFE